MLETVASRVTRTCTYMYAKTAKKRLDLKVLRGNYTPHGCSFPSADVYLTLTQLQTNLRQVKCTMPDGSEMASDGPTLHGPLRVQFSDPTEAHSWEICGSGEGHTKHRETQEKAPF